MLELRADWQLDGPLLLLWPFRRDVWRAQAQPAQRQLLDMLQAISHWHPVELGVPSSHYAQLRRQFGDQIVLRILPYSDAWPRDFGPFWLRQAKDRYIAVQFGFNAWQGLYPDHQADMRFAPALAQQHRVPLKRLPQLVFEGGAMTHDGDGTAILHAASIARNNPGWHRTGMERLLRSALGIQQIFWLQQAHGIDETGGHCDNQLQFISADTLVYAERLVGVDHRTQRLYQTQLQVWQQQLRNRHGQPYRWLALPQPAPLPVVAANYATVQRRAGVLVRGYRPLLASYLNMIRLPHALIVPQFGLEEDRHVIAQLQRHFPQLAVVGVAAEHLIEGGGGPHCLSLATPACHR